MRKFALLLAAALLVSASMLATSPTESIAAARAKQKQTKASEEGGSLFQAFTDQLGGKTGETKGMGRARATGMGMGRTRGMGMAAPE